MPADAGLRHRAGLLAEPDLAAASVCRVPKELEHKYLAGFVAGHAAAACTANHA